VEQIVVIEFEVNVPGREFAAAALDRPDAFEARGSDTVDLDPRIFADLLR
jgi:hypothetical protein